MSRVFLKSFVNTKAEVMHQNVYNWVQSAPPKQHIVVFMIQISFQSSNLMRCLLISVRTCEF